MLDAVAQPVATAPDSSTGSSARRTSTDNIDSLRNPELERLVGDARVLAIVVERERRAAALTIGGSQRADLQRLAIDDEDEPVVVALLLPRLELECIGVGVVGVGVAHREVAREVALAGQEQ